MQASHAGYRVARFALVALISFTELGGASNAVAATFETIHNFNVDDGAQPMGAPVVSKDGALFGTTSAGGLAGAGTLFRLKAGALTTLHSFGAASGDGTYPWGRLSVDERGNLYGTTNAGGQFGAGTIYRYRAADGVSVVYSFTGGPDGGYPLDGLTPDRNGSFYGGATYGGQRLCGSEHTGACGTVFSFDARSKQLVTLHTFFGSDGGWPESAPAFRGGTLVGTTYGDGSTGHGSIYSMQVDGTGFAIVGATHEAAWFQSGLVPDGAGALWGVAGSGGDFHTGGLYRIEVDGSFTWVFSFPADAGGFASATPVEDGAGNLYGTLPYGGAGCGQVYRYRPANGKFMILHEFDCLDGQTPWGGLVIDARGALYGTTESGGTQGGGTLFRIKP